MPTSGFATFYRFQQKIAAFSLDELCRHANWRLSVGNDLAPDERRLSARQQVGGFRRVLGRVDETGRTQPFYSVRYRQKVVAGQLRLLNHSTQHQVRCAWLEPVAAFAHRSSRFAIEYGSPRGSDLHLQWDRW